MIANPPKPAQPPALVSPIYPVLPKLAPYRPINLQGRLKTKTAFQTASLRTSSCSRP
ncbi:hypothetical protein [Neisseria elongata]|uniref:hypothetical protein n=1 Tax=Neisseria elongata TaxID=495 RepID=UPI0013B39E5B|nr:hypothetical protein [Neisseria elongata]